MVKNMPANAGDIREVIGSLDLEHSLKKGCQLTPVILPGESNGHRCLVGHGPKSPKESDMSEEI